MDAISNHNHITTEGRSVFSDNFDPVIRMVHA